MASSVWPCGNILVGTDMGCLMSLNTHSSEEAVLMCTHNGPVTALAFDAAGTVMASTGADGTFRVWDYSLGLQVCIAAITGHICCIVPWGAHTITHMPAALCRHGRAP
jgi:WD40 repeat protein